MTPQRTIFSKEAEASGYRLQYLQVYNWGTFGENRVWSLRPEGQTSLLTGANGSGKTTLVDALLTLLVPTRLRFYNQSSGTETRRDRTEQSYVLGAYGQTQEEGRLGASTQYLRKTDQVYSVIMACFYNEGLQQHLCLGQIRWFSSGGNQLNQEFFSAEKALDILEHQIQYEPGKYWKERLRKNHGLSFYKSFRQYQAFFLRAFGMRSEKALNLFNQTIGIKVLGRLDTFIREQMIEPGNPEEEFATLLNSFDTLLSSFQSFERARKQLELLEPVIQSHQAWQATDAALRSLQLQQEGLPIWFAEQHRRLLRQGIHQSRQELSLCQDRLAELEDQLNKAQEDRAQLMAAIEGDETGQKIKSLQKDIRSEEKELNRAKAERQRYNKLAEALRLKVDPSETEFLENSQRLLELREGNEQLRNVLDEKRINTELELRQLREEQAQLEVELRSLQNRKNQIPAQNVSLRERLLVATGASEKDIPFVGELLQVKKEEAEVWEGAIEQLLHNFALRLLVPEQHYAAVNRYVNQERLDGRIVYHRVSKAPSDFPLRSPQEDALYSKLNIHPQTPYAAWLEEQLRRRFDHHCTTDLKVFQRYDKALTPQGLSKQKDKHEKDDRRQRRGRASYVLGWDNKEKIRLLRQEYQQRQQQLQKTESELSKLKQQLEAAEEQKAQLRDLGQFRSFQDIDWPRVADRIQRLEGQLRELQASSNRLQTLQRQLDELKEESFGLGRKKEKEIQSQTRLQDRLGRQEALLQQKEQLLSQDFAWPEGVREALEARLSDLSPSLSLDNISRIEDQSGSKLRSQVEKQEQQREREEKSLRKAMHAYKNPPESVRQQFPTWMGETQDLSPEREGVNEYLAIYEQIKGEKLLEYERRFREYLDEKMVGDMGNFQTALDNRLEIIEESIRELNASLRKIDFRTQPRTYIQLVVKPQTKPEIREFRQQLRSDWKFDTGEYERTKDVKLLEKSFHQIKNIIEGLKADENRRKRLLDVRNWLVFHATEHFQENDEQYMVYESTGHLSGGEKAQITYTILGAALAYQFGIDRGGFQDKSFRFIVVDEAFSKLDPEKSRYLMDLCQQLHLQLLVVTPLDKIHVAEPYIQACHYVENKEKRHSRVYNLSLEEYQERKQQFEAAEEAS